MDNSDKKPQVRFKGFTHPWEQRKLGECFDERQERSANGELISVTINSGVKRFSELERHDNSSEDKSNYKIVQVGDIAYNSMRMWQGASGYSPYNGILSPAYTVIIPKNEIDSLFFSYVFKRPTMIHKFKINSQGITSDTWNLKFPALSEIECNVPLKREQQQIAKFFKTLDNLITLHQRKCEKLKNIKKSLLGKMFPQNGEKFPQIRFKGFTHAWEQRKFGEVGVLLKNNTFSRAELSYEASNIKNIHYGDVLIKFGEVLDVQNNDIPYISPKKNIEKYKSFLRDGDIIIADTAEDESVGKCCEISNIQDDFILSGLHTMPFRPQQFFGRAYLGYFINSNAYHNQLIPLMQGIKVTSISKSAIQDTNIFFPSTPEQEKIGSFFETLDNLITLHQRKCEKLKNIKKSLLEKMFPACHACRQTGRQTEQQAELKEGVCL